MSKLDPKNREEAFTYQFEDDIKVLRACSLNEKAFNQQLHILEMHIMAYRSKRLRNVCAKAQQKTKERNAFMEKNYPSIYKKRK